MNTLFLQSRFAKILFFGIAFGAFFVTAFTNVNAQTTTFAQFLEQNGTQDFVFTNNTSSASFSAVGGGSAIAFRYQNISGLDPSLAGFQDAHLFITTTTTQTASINGSNTEQPLNQTVTIQIIRDTPAPVGVGSGSRTNLLTAVFTPSGTTPTLVGSTNGNSATMSATTPDHTVTFTSDFLGFALTTQRNLGLSFSSVTPSIALGAGNFLQSFTAAGTGTFASNPVPVYVVPTAAPVSVSGRVLTSEGAGLRNAAVFLTEANGTRHKATTGTFGNYSFPEVAAGQIVTIEVASKRFSFAARSVSLEENIAGLNFIAEE